MILPTVTSIRWSDVLREWTVERLGPLVVRCDHPGCGAEIVSTGHERNGPNIELIYGCDGWTLGEIDLCPLHDPGAP